jgi:hypothetical protein
MITLETVAGVEARIFTLQDRPPFMVGTDLAEVYGSSPKALNQAVKRNPERFPDDFMFSLTESEIAVLRSQNVTASAISSKSRYQPLVFTHAGAYALSAVLKTPVAAEVSVIIHRAFAAMEARALKEAQLLLFKIQTEAMMRKPSRIAAVNGVTEGLSFGQILAMTSASGPKLARNLRELKMLGLIERLPEGTPDEQQIELFPVTQHG